MKKKNRTRVSEGVYRIAYWNAEKGKYLEPKKCFETYRAVTVDGVEKRETRCFQSHSEAKAFRGTTAALTTKKEKTIGEALEEYLAQYKGDITTKQKLESNFRHLDSVKNTPVEDFDEAAMDRLLTLWRSKDYLAAQKSTRTTYRNELIAIRQFLRHYASRSKTGYQVPILKEHWKHAIVRPGKSKPEKRMSPEEWAKVQVAMRQATEGTPYEDILPTMQVAQYLLFARIQEVAALEFEDIDAKAGAITLNKRIKFLRKRVGNTRQVKADGHKATAGKVIYSRMAVDLLLRFAMKRGIRQGALFRMGGKPLSYRMIQFYYDKAFKLAGVPLTGTHVIRHASLREFQSTCRDLNLTKLVSGHASIKQVERYAQGSAQEVARYQEQMEEKLRAASIALDTVG